MQAPPIFIATLRAVASWPFFRVARSLRIHSDMLVARALKNSQLIRQLPDESHVIYGTGHLNQSLRDRAAKDTIGLHALPRSARESVNASCLPPASGKPSARQAVFDLVGRNAGLELKCNARGCIQPEFDDGEKALGLLVGEKSESSVGS
jgi:hypothetical protein